MKPEREVLAAISKESFRRHSVSLQPGPNQSAFFHYHPEHEILLVLAGEGTHCVGDAIGYHSAGDLLCLGGTLPHAFSANAWLCGDTGCSEYLVVQFAHGFLGEGLFEKPEFASIANLLQRAAKGIFIRAESAVPIAARLQEILSSSSRQS